MKATSLIPCFAAAASANILFNHVRLTCNLTSPKIYLGCLRGQTCTANGECLNPSVDNFPRPPRLSDPNRLERKQNPAYSIDGSCGPQNGNTICNVNSNVYDGGCCSQYGWCGKTPGHCGPGCISGCTIPPPSTVTPPTNTAPRGDGLCGAGNGDATCDSRGPFGGCCSKYGFCGSSIGHCLVANGCQNGCSDGQPPRPGPAPVVTVDGTCGSSRGNTVCGNWPNGNCCSLYGFCGNTESHCGAGCQSGNCLGPPVVPAPGPKPAPSAPNGGSYRVIGQSGVPAMHAGLLPNGRVVFLDKLEDYSQLRTPNGYYAMSSEYDPQTNTVVALSYLTNAFCSGGAFLPDGSMVSLGGNGALPWLNPNILSGFNAIRRLYRSATNPTYDSQGWQESGNNKLASNRWYASAQILPDGTLFVASGSLNGLDPAVLSNNNPTYEILSANAVSQGRSIPMDILSNNQPYYMYPFVHLMRDGNIFIFVSKSSQIFNVGSNTVVKGLPDLPGDYRTYPNTGGSVLLALSSVNNWNPDIMICGGGAYQDISSPTDPSCGRIQPLSANSVWEMDAMPEGRGMVEGTLLPDGTVIWLTGGSRGAQGFGLMANPTLQGLLYDPRKPFGQRWNTLASSPIPRLYHSVVVLLLDGTLLIVGSNPNEMPVLQADAQHPHPTEFRVEKFTPPYLQGANANRRPLNIQLSSTQIKAGGSFFRVSFKAPPNAQKCSVVLYHGGFVTHSLHMGHRMLQLDVGQWKPDAIQQDVAVNNPPNTNVAPPGPYVVYVVVDGVPSVGQFVQVS